MTQEEAEKFCGSWLPAWTGNRPDVLIGFYSADAYYRDPQRPAGIRGRARLLAYFKKLLARYPDWIWRQDEVLAVEKGFVLKWQARIPTSTGVITETGMDLVEIVGGKIARNEVYFDRMALARTARRAVRRPPGHEST